jgi:hypothetical protein
MKNRISSDFRGLHATPDLQSQEEENSQLHMGLVDVLQFQYNWHI